MFSLPLQYSLAASGQQLWPSCHPEMDISLVCVCSAAAGQWAGEWVRDQEGC